MTALPQRRTRAVRAPRHLIRILLTMLVVLAVAARPAMAQSILRDAETEDFLEIAEKITGLPYQWGRYDVVAMVPSFPYGGMENPCITFVSSTCVAGDRSGASVVALISDRSTRIPTLC